MNSVLALIVLSVFLSLAPMRALWDSVTYTCHDPAYADDKGGGHKSEDDPKLVFLVDGSWVEFMELNAYLLP